MKDKILSYISLAFSIAALCYAAWVHHHAAQLADQAVQKREQRFVQAFASKVKAIYQELGVTNIVANPTTLDELFSPYLETLNRMVVSTAEDGKKTP